MIFSSLFTPKWKSKKVEQRLLAVSEMDVTKTKEKNILSQLAENDADDKVKLAALKRINELSLWWKTYRNSNTANIVNVAEKEIFNSLTQQTPSQEDLALLIKRCDKAAQLTQLLPFVGDFDKKLSLLKRIGKKQVIVDSFIAASDAQQIMMLPIMKQYQLEKAISQHAKAQLKDKLAAEAKQQQLDALKPIEVQKAVTLILAKLNALRDKFDYEYCQSNYADLTKQWHELELTYLTEPEKTTSKYNDIVEKCERHLASLKDEHDKAQAKAAHEKKVSAIKGHAKEQISQTEVALNNLLLNPTTGELAVLQQHIVSLKQVIDEHSSLALETDLLSKKLTSFEQQSEEINTVLAQLPDIAKVVARGESLAIAGDLAALDAAEVEKTQWFDSVQEQIAGLPKPLYENYRKQAGKFVSDWKKAHKALFDEVSALQKGVNKQLKDIKRLMDAGRFKVCFGIFKGVQETYEKLPSSVQARLENDYKAVNESLTKVNDWQREISLPKRHELIAEVDAKIAEKMDDVNTLSEWIKLTRKRWNELGYVSSEEEKVLDEAFNAKLEIAFTPCREHFAALEVAREENFSKRKQVLSQYEVLANTLESLTLKEIDKQHKQLRQAWRDAGEVDNKRYKQLLQSLKPTESRILDYIKQVQKENAQQKEALVKRAEESLKHENITQVIDDLKALQGQWKAIGFAGKVQENKLWNAFRAVNDKAFALRDSQRNEEKAKQLALLAELTERFSAIEINQDEHTPIAQLDKRLSQLTSLQASLKEHYLLKSDLNTQVTQCIQQIKDAINAQLNHKDRAKIEQLFASLEQGDLPSEWQQSSAANLSRHQLTLRLELLNELTSPECDADLRLNEQVTLLQEKVNGEDLSNITLLKQWLSHGVLDENESTLLARIKPVFI